jgi:hypothetical protein
VVIHVPVRDDRDFQVKLHAFFGVNHCLETHRFAPAGSREGGAQLRLTVRRKGSPGGFDQGFANDLFASDLRLV